MNKALWMLPLFTLASCVSPQELENCQQSVKILQQSQQALEQDLKNMRATSKEQQEQAVNDHKSDRNG